jgi:PAS domain S-box-containing protein
MSLSSTLSGYRADAILDSIVDNSLCSVMVTQAAPQAPIVYVNDAFTALTGYTPAEVIGKSPRLLQGPKTDHAVLDRLREDLSAGRVFEGQAVNYRRDCSEFDMFWRVFPVYGADEKPVYFVALQQEARV